MCYDITRKYELYIIWNSEDFFFIIDFCNKSVFIHKSFFSIKIVRVHIKKNVVNFLLLFYCKFVLLHTELSLKGIHKRYLVIVVVPSPSLIKQFLLCFLLRNIFHVQKWKQALKNWIKFCIAVIFTRVVNFHIMLFFFSNLFEWDWEGIWCFNFICLIIISALRNVLKIKQDESLKS